MRLFDFLAILTVSSIASALFLAFGMGPAHAITIGMGLLTLGISGLHYLNVGDGGTFRMSLGIGVALTGLLSGCGTALGSAIVLGVLVTVSGASMFNYLDYALFIPHVSRAVRQVRRQ